MLMEFHVILTVQDGYGVRTVDAVYAVNRAGTTRMELFRDVKAAVIEKINREGNLGHVSDDAVVLFFSAEPNELPVTVDRAVV